MSNPTEAETYRTSDLYFAAFLKVAAVPFHDTTKVQEDGRSKVVFEFHPHEMGMMRTLKQEYFAGKAKVSAIEYTQAIKMMKQLTHMG
jgi:hypothetical protein